MQDQQKTLQKAIWNLEGLISQFSSNDIMKSIVVGQNDVFDCLREGLKDVEVDYIWFEFHPYTSYAKGSSVEIEFGLDELVDLKHNLSFGLDY